MPLRTEILALTLAAIVGCALPAAARERPGTPAQARATLVDPQTVRITWINTRNVSQGSGFFPEATYFDIEGRTDPSISNFPSNPLRNQAVTYDISGLRPGEHCFRLWSRESPNGVRSEVPGAWTCATVPGPQAPALGASPAIGSTQPLQGRLIWIAPALYYQGRQPSGPDMGQFHDTGDTEPTGGLVLITAGNARCAYPWRHVLYQYGGWPSLQPASFTTPQAAYGLCWFPHLPSAAESIIPQPPHPPSVGSGGNCYHGVNCP